jgi:hypothetical protein
LRELLHLRPQRLAPIAVDGSPGLQREGEELLLAGREADGCRFFVEPAGGPAAVRRS